MNTAATNAIRSLCIGVPEAALVNLHWRVLARGGPLGRPVMGQSPRVPFATHRALVRYREPTTTGGTWGSGSKTERAAFNVADRAHRDPVAVIVFPGEICPASRSWAERA
jgi:hypothetical protein